ncbi:DUF2997 domain-containing protein [Priestia megaterium]|uniref:DUF2997 domain-containing protein n=1 Tax=Priestia megaterium TaxID=1404 RepID=UPI00317D4B38
MKKQIKIEISSDGKITAETLGIKGKDCLSYIKLLEQLLDAETVDSEYTNEYFENKLQNHHHVDQVIQKEQK